jgi:formate hydrogenlyase subunit 4
MGGGLVLALGGFSVALAAADTRDPYAQLGSSRATTFGALIEPSVLFVVFAVALITTTDLPYAMAGVDRSSLAQAIRPAHLFAAVAFFLVVLSDTGRIPVETHTSTLEFGMIDEARTFEHSGPALALLKWGSAIKQMVLYVILVDVFAAPWGLAGSRQAGSVLLGVPVLLGKALGVGAIFAIIDNSFSKLRLYKITEFMASAFALSAVAVLVLYLGGG